VPPVRKADGDDSAFRRFRARGKRVRELGQQVCLIGHEQLLSI
jgi:hypothetical protein